MQQARAGRQHEVLGEESHAREVCNYIDHILHKVVPVVVEARGIATKY